jgi:hypothetical protein
VSLTINGEPSLQFFSGWVTVLEAADQFANDQQVQIGVAAITPGAPGTNPALTYSVAVCGGHAFTGVLLIGGDARLQSAQELASLAPGEPLSTAGSPTSLALDPRRVVMFDDSVRHNLDLGAVQVVPLTMRQPPACVSTNSTQFVGEAVTVTGRAAAPVQRPWRLLWWEGPRSVQAWPLVGAFPQFPFGDLGAFTGDAGLPGTWLVPPHREIGVDVGGIGGRVQIDAAQPQLTNTTALIWDGTVPIHPIARLTDVDSLTAWQNIVVGATIGLAVGASLLAAVLMQWIFRPAAAPSEPVSMPASLRDRTRRVARCSSRVLPWRGTFLVAVLALLARRRSKRH